MYAPSPFREQRKSKYYDFCYLSIVLDAYTEEIVGHCVGQSLQAIYPLEALEIALNRLDRDATYNLIHHSDRGVRRGAFFASQKIAKRCITYVVKNREKVYICFK